MARKRFNVTLPNGEKVWLTGNTISEAFANGLERYGGTQDTKRSKAPTLREFVENTYRPIFIKNLAPTTVSNYESYLALNIFPFLGDMQMDEITVATMQEFYDWMSNASERGRKNDLNCKSIERVGGLVSRIYRVAIEMKIVEDTPIKKTLLRNNGSRAKHHTAISYEDMDMIKRGIPLLEDERQRLYMALLAYAGMRPEEILGLRWEHVYLEKGYCDMVRTVTYPDKKNTVVRDCGKTESSIRTIALPDPVINILSAVNEKVGYVIYGKDKETPSSSSTHKRTYSGAFKILGIYGKHCNYDFRTTFGTQLCENGFTAKQTADLMGHADTRMVETVYARSRQEGILRQRDRLNELSKDYVI